MPGDGYPGGMYPGGQSGNATGGETRYGPAPRWQNRRHDHVLRDTRGVD